MKKSTRRALSTYGKELLYAWATRMFQANSTKGKSGMAKHPGFKAVASRIARKEGVSPRAAGAILASGTRKASAGAKKSNPRLKRVKG